MKRYRAENREKIKASQKDYYVRKYRAAEVERKYGITQEGYDHMLKEQGGACAICGGPPLGRGVRFHVDHDHATGAVRGLLCNACNPGLGKFKDDPEILRAAIRYLEKAR